MKRDLSAFQTPPARTVAVPPPPDRPPSPQPATTTPTAIAPFPNEQVGEWDDAPRRKLTTSIPARLHRLLRQEADQQARFKGDLVIEALHAHGSVLGCDHGRLARRRVRVEDPTQCQLYLTDQEREQLDQVARHLGVSRSGVVTMLLERAFDTALNR